MIEAVFLDLSRIENGSLESVIYRRIGSLAETDVISRLYWFFKPPAYSNAPWSKGVRSQTNSSELASPSGPDLQKKYKRETKLWRRLKIGCP